MIKHCEKHGDYESKSQKIFGSEYFTRCPKCDEEAQAEFDRQAAEEKAAKRKQDLIDKLSKIGVPERFKKCRLENYQVTTPEQQKALDACKAFLSLFSGNETPDSPLFLIGSFGTGKTHLAIGCVYKLIVEYKIKSGIYTTTMKMIRDIRSSYHHMCNSTEQQIIDRYVNTDLLILDEVGVQNGTDNEQLLIYEVLNGRYENQLPTIIISNLGFKDMGNYLGKRVVDRIRGKNGIMALMNWESFRNR